MDYADNASLRQDVEAVAFTSGDGAAQLRAGVSVDGGLVVSLAGAGEFRPDPAQADALGRWLVAKAAEYRGHEPHAWVMVPVADKMPSLGELAGFDTVEQATAVVAGLCGLEGSRTL